MVDTAKKGLMWTSIWQILAKKKGLEWASFQRLGEVQKALNLSLPQAVDLVSHTLHKEPYTRAEVCQILEMKEEDFVNKVLSAKTAQGKGVMSQIPDLSQEINWLLTYFCSIIKHWRLRVLYHLEVYYENRSCVCNYSADFQVISTSHPCFLGGRESLIFQTYLWWGRFWGSAKTGDTDEREP